MSDEVELPQRAVVSVCGVCGASRYDDGTAGSHQSYCAELRLIYNFMPPAHQRLIDEVPFGPTHRKLIELWAIMDQRREDHPAELTGDELDARNRDREDEERIQLALEGKLGEPAQKVVSARVVRCTSVVGCTWTALKINDREKYRRFLRGSMRAVVRAGAIKRGEVTAADALALRRREDKRREARAYADAHGGQDARAGA